MRPTHLSMTNFMPYAQPTELDLAGIHLACLAGENGHGKSAIIDALTWALWGKARARRDDELIHLGEEQMEVRLDFLLGDEQYRVIRQRDSAGRGNSTLEFQVGNNSHWAPLTGDSIKETQEIIDHTIGMDYVLFTNSALLLQGRADEFTNQPPGERKRILGEILNLSLWDSLEERAKLRVREAEDQLASIVSKAELMARDLEKLADYEAALEGAVAEEFRLRGELDEAEHSLSQAKEKAMELSFKRQALTEAQNEVDNRRRELSALTQRIAVVDPEAAEKCNKLLIEVRMELQELAGLEEKRQIEEGERGTLSEEKATLTATNSKLREDMDALKEEMELLQKAGATCPLCDSELTDEHRGEILAGKQAQGEEKATQYRQNKDRIEQREKGIADCQHQLQGLEMQVAREKTLRALETRLVGELAKLESEAQYLGQWQEQALALEGQIGQLNDKVTALTAELGEADQVSRAKQELEMTVNRLAEDLSRANLRVGAAQQQIEHCQYLTAEKEKLEAQQQEGARAKALYDELRTAFGKRGIQAMIIETVLPEIEEQANLLLDKMTDGRMSVSFESQRETKSGTISETLDIRVSDELGVRSYDLFSGGERFRLDFAIRIAISKLLAHRAGARLQTLIMDEGFGSQDASGRDRLVEAIQSVANSFDLILVVTHIEELREAFPNRIEVVKGPAGSVVSVN